MQNEPNLIDVEIECSRCGILAKSSYSSDEVNPSIYFKCSFCGALLRWRKDKGVNVIIPADQIQYIKNI